MLVCGRSPAYESAVFWMHIFFVSYIWAFTVLPFESLTSATYSISLESPKSVIVAKVVITKSCVHFLPRRAANTKEEQERYPYNLQFYIDFYRDHGSLSINCYI